MGRGHDLAAVIIALFGLDPRDNRLLSPLEPRRHAKQALLKRISGLDRAKRGGPSEAGAF